ncbi:MAG: Membrane-associated zinc metalloprotease [Desulfotomaculum sp. 46_296]|nr:MAG: Membrane-associated zinc metalloprotease [Desulfotomaculum sp. 46_296]
MLAIQTFIATVVIFGLMIIFHEFGHFIVAKRVGIRVQEFSIGFGLKLASFVKGETAYNLRLFPIGGFVRMAGMEPDDEVPVDDERSFNKKTILQRVAVISAGSLMNFVLAVLLFALLFIYSGFPMPSTTVEKLVSGGPAELAGLKAGDKIVAIDKEQVNRWEKMSAIINAHPDQIITVTIERNGKQQKVLVLTDHDEKGQGKLGIYPAFQNQRLDPFSSLVKGAEYTGRFVVLIIDLIGQMITGKLPADLGGPVRIIYEIKNAVGFGISNLLQLAAFLSINLGLFNLFPIPALDGSRIMFLVIEWLRGRPVDPVKENFVHLIGFGILLLFFVFVTYNDVLQLIQK